MDQDNDDHPAVCSKTSPTFPQPLVSIVLPTYNRAARLQVALRSCLQQTYKNLEVIVVDDGSSDETPQLVAAIQSTDPRVLYIHQGNKKLPAALNTGFRMSRGEYLTWTSDDNQFHSDAIELLVEGLNENPEAGFVYTDFDIVDDEGRFLRRVHLPGPEKLREYNCVRTCFMYRRQVYQEIGDYDPDCLLVEDYDYWLRVQQRFKMVHIPDISPYSYGEHKESLTAQRGREQKLAVARLRLKHIRLRLKDACSRREKVAAFVSTRAPASRALAELGDWRGAVSAALMHALCQPWRRYRWICVFEVLQDAVKAQRELANTPPIPSG